MLRWFAVVLIVLTLAGCGGPSSHGPKPFAKAQIDCIHASVLAAPKGTPDWLINRICRTASALGDAHPNKIVIRLNLHGESSTGFG